MTYTILFKETARKELYRLPDKTLKKVSTLIDSLAINPRPAGVKKLKGTGENLWRARVGDYRVIYLIDDSIRIVNIRKIGNRREVYDK
jgi:mRNA interferase RelE/StbE